MKPRFIYGFGEPQFQETPIHCLLEKKYHTLGLLTLLAPSCPSNSSGLVLSPGADGTTIASNGGVGDALELGDDRLGLQIWDNIPLYAIKFIGEYLLKPQKMMA